MTPNLMKKPTDTSKFAEHPNNPNNDQTKDPTATSGTTNNSMFDKEGAVGKQFTAEGSIGGMAQAIGGPFDKDGMIGKQFDAESGAIGSTAQSMADGQSNKMSRGG